MFDEAFAAELLASEDALGGTGSLVESCTGTLVNSENFQALSLLLPTLRSSISSIYIDPPYNTAASEIAYKNKYKHASWLSLLKNRLDAAAHLLTPQGFLSATIDYAELFSLGCIADATFGSDNRVGIVSILINPKGRQHERYFSASSEYMLVYAKSASDNRLRRVTINPAKAAEFIFEDDHGRYRLDEFARIRSSTTRRQKPKFWYPLYVSNDLSIITTDPIDGFHRVFPVDSDGKEYSWKVIKNTFLENNNSGLYVAIRSEDGNIRIYNKFYEQQVIQNVWTDSRYFPEFQGTNVLKNLVGEGLFSYPKSYHAVADALKLTSHPNTSILDFFAGSGTTAHACMHLQRSGDGGRQFTLVEMGAYFEDVLRQRVCKNIYADEWRECQAIQHDQGLSSLVKCFAVESYEDALNNLPTPTGDMFDGRPGDEADPLIRYALDLELGPHLLGLDIFRDPWGHTINAQLAGDDEIKRHRVDLVETFNYLIGLRVHRYGPIEHYSADFERADHEDGLGRLKVVRRPGTRGGLRPDPDGPFVFQRVEGEINDADATRVLVVWRKLTDHPERDAAVLEAWMARHRESTTERTEHREYQRIYINGPVTLPQPTQDIRTVLPLEETFKARMFEDTDGVA